MLRVYIIKSVILGNANGNQEVETGEEDGFLHLVGKGLIMKGEVNKNIRLSACYRQP